MLPFAMHLGFESFLGFLDLLLLLHHVSSRRLRQLRACLLECLLVLLLLLAKPGKSLVLLSNDTCMFV